MRAQVERWSRRPVIRPWIGRPELLRLIGIARVHVRVQRRLEIAEDCVVDAQCTCCHQDCLPEPAKVAEKEVARAGLEGIEIRYDGIGQQERVAPQYLPLAEYRPT